MPKPKPNESEEDFISRCIPIVIDEGTTDDPDQATAICYSIWEDHLDDNKEETQMTEKRIKYFTSKAKEVDDRILRFIGSDESVDRDNEVIKSSGWKLKNYRKNPVVLVNHQHYELPVARSKKVWIEDKKLMFDIEFPEADVHPQGDTLYKLYKNGYMNATSVGFLPNMKKVIWGEKEGEPSVTFKEQELLEISLVSVPANPQALMTSKGIKKAIKDEVVDELEIKDLGQFLEEIAENLKKDEEIENKEENSKKNESNTNTDISISSEKKICEDCGVEIHLCSTCFEKKESEEYFKKVYESLIDDK